MAPAPHAFFRNPAGLEKLVAKIWLLPHKLYSHSGRATRYSHNQQPRSSQRKKPGLVIAPAITARAFRSIPHHTFASLPSIRQVAAAQATASTATTFITGLPPRLSLRRAIT